MSLSYCVSFVDLFACFHILCFGFFFLIFEFFFENEKEHEVRWVGRWGGFGGVGAKGTI